MSVPIAIALASTIFGLIVTIATFVWRGAIITAKVNNNELRINKLEEKIEANSDWVDKKIEKMEDKLNQIITQLAQLKTIIMKGHTEGYENGTFFNSQTTD